MADPDHALIEQKRTTNKRKGPRARHGSGTIRSGPHIQASQAGSVWVSPIRQVSLGQSSVCDKRVTSPSRPLAPIVPLIALVPAPYEYEYVLFVYCFFVRFRFTQCNKKYEYSTVDTVR